MSVQWAIEMAGDSTQTPLAQVASEIVARFADGAATPAEVPRLHDFLDSLRLGAPMSAQQNDLRELSHRGYLRGAMVAMAVSLEHRPRADVALALARELMDAVAPELGVRLCQCVLALPEVDNLRYQAGSSFLQANSMLAATRLEQGDDQAALRHFEAVLSVDVSDPRALRGWSAATRQLERRGVAIEQRSRGLALLEGLDELELAQSFGSTRYELQRPLGRGRHAVVYQAFDRHVGRDVAIKRLLDPQARRSPVPPRVLEARFFAEARTLAKVRSPYVVALLDVRPKQRFIALALCRGGNLRLALRRGLVDRSGLDRIGGQLAEALRAVHSAGAVHRDVKPANILVRSTRDDSPIALADFGLAVTDTPRRATGRAGTLRYLAPEVRTGTSHATAASDLFSAGVVLLELATTPNPLPASFDRIDGNFDASAHVPDELPDPWCARLRRLLSRDPEERIW